MNFLSLILCGLLGAAHSFYLYDRVHNKPITYHLGDSSNVFYTSKAFHSIEYATNKNHTEIKLPLKRVNTTRSSKSLPNIL